MTEKEKQKNRIFFFLKKKNITKTIKEISLNLLLGMDIFDNHTIIFLCEILLCD